MDSFTSDDSFFLFFLLDFSDNDVASSSISADASFNLSLTDSFFFCSSSADSLLDLATALKRATTKKIKENNVTKTQEKLEKSIQKQ